jgi:hypothetical protein
MVPTPFKVRERARNLLSLAGAPLVVLPATTNWKLTMRSKSIWAGGEREREREQERENESEIEPSTQWKGS